MKFASHTPLIFFKGIRFGNYRYRFRYKTKKTQTYSLYLPMKIHFKPWEKEVVLVFPLWSQINILIFCCVPERVKRSVRIQKQTCRRLKRSEVAFTSKPSLRTKDFQWILVKRIGVSTVSCSKIKRSNYSEIKYLVINVGGLIGHFLFWSFSAFITVNPFKDKLCYIHHWLYNISLPEYFLRKKVFVKMYSSGKNT